MLRRIFLLLTALLLASSQLFAAEITKKLDPATIPPPNDITYYPQSIVDRPLILPQKLMELSGRTEYRQVTKSARGLDLRVRGRYGVMDRLEASVEASLLPISYFENEEGKETIFIDDGFQFGGILAGAGYALLEENERYPEMIAGLKIGVLGKGPLSLTNGSNFSVIPGVVAKKILRPGLSVDGAIALAFGNGGSGLYLMEAGGALKAFDKLDLKGSLSLEGVGFDETVILSVQPGVMYHWSDKLDIIGGFRVGLVGGEALGNNLNLGVLTRF